jgi:MSHA pilin protein MshA
MKNQKGFTLIELVVVIVILGILAVTAAPRFLNLQSDARASSLQGLKGAMAGAGSIVYGKAAIEGIETSPTGTVSDGVNTVLVAYGYPDATAAGIGAAVEGLQDGGDWAVATGGTPGNTPGSSIVYTFADNGNDNCTVTYTLNSVSGAAPIISAASASDC